MKRLASQVLEAQPRMNSEGNTELRRVTELGQATTITFPSRWVIQHHDYHSALNEVGQLGKIASRAINAITGLYVRICDTIRENQLSDDDVRSVLSPHMPPPRISELLRVAHADPSVYARYKTGVFGFKTALERCRGYHIMATETILKRKTLRAAERLVTLTRGNLDMRVKDWRVTIRAESI